MPIVIYPSKSPRQSLAYLCDYSWELPEQVSALEEWLKVNRKKVEPGDYVADIGFMPRADAAGGGATISPESMRTMAQLGIWLFLSEYRGEEHLHDPKEPNHGLGSDAVQNTDPHIP